MRSIGNDIRYALRQLRKSPGFAAIAILTLAIGIGATTAIFTLVYDVLLKPLPYAHPEQLVVMREQVAEFKDIYPTLPMNANNFVNWQQHSKSFQAMALMGPDSAPLGAGGHPLQIGILRTTAGIFPVLAAAPQLGRAFTSQEDQSGSEHVVVLMHGLWEQEFHGDPKILGKTVTLDGYPYTVIGVMPASFHLPSSQTMQFGYGTSNSAKSLEAIVPLALNKAQLQLAIGDFSYFGLGRLKPGASATQANAEIDALQRAISANLPANEKATLSAALTPFQRYLVGNNTKPLGILLAAVAGLLLIGCINIMNLLLARAVGRRQEMAVASALGATRADLLRFSIREAGVLAVIGGALAILLAAVTVPILQNYLPSALDFRGTLHIDWAGAGCAVFLAITATLLAGAAPAWMGWRTQPQEALRGESRSASESRGGKRMRKTLVAAEVSISLILVLMTGLLTASLYRLMHVERGFVASAVMTAEIDLPAKAYLNEHASGMFYKQLVARLHQVPGLADAAIVSTVPLTGDLWGDILKLPGDTRSVFQMPSERFRWVSPGYFQTIHLPLIQGRFLSNDDYGRNDALISELTAKTLWHGKNPVGQQFSMAGRTDDKPFTVIGVIGNARTITLAKPDPMLVYVPYWYRSDLAAGLVVRTQQDAGTMADVIRRIVWSIDPAASVPEVRSLGGIIAGSVEARRFEMRLLLLFAISAWMLAGLGVYGVVSYSVVQRRQEIGLRMALGAQRINIYTQVLREGLVPVLAGCLVGVAVAFGFANLMGSLLFQVSPFNPAIALLASGCLMLAGVAACMLPARRASSVDPMQALRAE